MLFDKLSVKVKKKKKSKQFFILFFLTTKKTSRVQFNLQ